jgi:putative acyl-CoA dehydrogenase
MQNVLADLCVEAEAHTLTAMKMAAVYDQSETHGDPLDVELFRIGVSVSKYYITKRQPNFAYECLEVLGGNGFVEDFPLARLFRHSPLNSVWEGSGNVIALDVLRAHKSLPTLLKEIKLGCKLDGRFDAYVDQLEKDVKAIGDNPLSSFNQRNARNTADRLGGLPYTLNNLANTDVVVVTVMYCTDMDIEKDIYHNIFLLLT